MKKLLLFGLIAFSASAFSQATVTYATKTYNGGSVGLVYTSSQLQGTLTSVSVNATLSASVASTYANDLTVIVTPTSNIATTPYILQVGGYNTFGSVPEKGTWSNGASATVGTVVNSTYTLTTPINFTTNPAYSVWLGNGYVNSNPATNSGTWTNITFTLNGVATSTLGVTEITSSSDLGVTLYPNPVTDKINVVSKDSKINLVSIVDLSGKAVKTVLRSNKTNELSVNVAELNAGSYILIADTDKGKFSKKFIKK